MKGRYRMKNDDVPSRVFALAAVAMASVTGCAGWRVEPETAVQQSAKTSGATLVVAEITHPRDLTVSAPFYVAMQREIPQQLEATHVSQRLMSERDLGIKGVPGAAFALRYRVVEDHVVLTSSGAGCVAALVGTGSLTIIPLFFLGLCTRRAEHDLTVEARVFDVNHATVQRIQDSSSNEMINVYDTSSLTPLLRKEYKVTVEVVGRAFGGHLDAADTLELSKREAGEAVRQLLAHSLEDVARALP
jgi:hypothetical protein